MKMYFDKFSEIGSPHKENEDFAVVGDEEHPFVIVSDGCSGSKSTSTGSRILSLSTAKYFKDLFFNCFLNCQDIGQTTIKHASSVARLLGLNQECLDATLITAYKKDNCIHVCMWGDGVIYYKHKGREYDFLAVNYTPELPYYLSYSLNHENNRHYCDLAQKGEIVKIELEFIGDDGVTTYPDPLEPTQISIFCEDLEYVLISTDGFSSFIDKENKPIEKKIIDDKINSFKRFNGEFIGRRMPRMMKNFAKEGITHYDDFTIAGISFVDIAI